MHSLLLVLIVAPASHSLAPQPQLAAAALGGLHSFPCHFLSLLSLRDPQRGRAVGRAREALGTRLSCGMCAREADSGVGETIMDGAFMLRRGRLCDLPALTELSLQVVPMIYLRDQLPRRAPGWGRSACVHVGLGLLSPVPPLSPWTLTAEHEKKHPAPTPRRSSLILWSVWRTPCSLPLASLTTAVPWRRACASGSRSLSSCPLPEPASLPASRGLPIQYH
jgi:hypothetical protein